MLPVNYSATATQRELDKLKNELDTVQGLATGPTGATGPAGPQGATGATGPQGPAGQDALDVLDEDDMASNSATKLASQQSIKAYVDNVTSGIAVEHFGAVGDGTTDDTSALQAAFSYGLTNKEKILLSGKTYKYSGLLAVVNGPLCVEGQGVNSVLLKADSYTGAAFEVNNTFGILGNFYPNSYDDDTKDSDPSTLLSPSFSQFTILGESRSAVGRGFDFKDRNDMVRITDVNIFHLNGSAIRFTGTFGNLRESYFTRVQIRMCGSSTEPAVDLEMPTFRHTSCSSSLVSGKTRFTLNGQGDDFSGLTGNRKIRVQGTRNDGGSVEWPVESVISNTVVELPYDITSTDPETGEPYGQNVQGAPCTFYRDVDGLNHIVFTDCQIVGCYGTYLRLSHERVNFFRRVVFDNLMVHGSLNKFLTNPGDTSESQQGPVGDLILIEGAMGSVYFRGLRLNTPEVDKTDPNNPVKYAGVRIKPGRTLDLDIPDRIWFSDIDMLNLNNNGEAMFVVEKVKNLSVTGTVAASRDSGTELKVLSDGVTDGLDYEVVSGTSSNIRDRGLEPAFDIADNISDRVFINTNLRKLKSLNFKDFGAVGDGVTDDTQALQDAFDYAAANRAILEPTKGVFLVNAPIVVGDYSGIKGYASNNQFGPCVIKAGSSFTSTYTMTYYDPEVGGGSTPLTYNVASILISKAWVDGEQLGNPIHIGKILLNGDNQKGSRGEPIHGLMMQAWASKIECNTANTTGYGIFFNLQKPNGDFAGNHVGNHFKANRVYRSGITPTGDSAPLSYTLNGQTHYYGAFQAGSLEFSRDSEGNQSRGKATDGWITDFVQASTCTGTAIRVINGGGWSGTGIHLNGPGRHGIYVDGCLSSGWTNNYVDGWGAHIDDNEGNFYAFWFADIFGFEDNQANASLTCSDNRVRLRDIPNKTGNKLIGYGAKGTAASTARVVMNGNSYTARPDVNEDTVAISYPFNFSGIQQGGLNITLNGNDVDPDSYPEDTNLYLVNFGRYIQFSSQTGNSWQTVTAKPTRRGARGEIVYRKDAVNNEPTHYLNISGIDHGYDWKAMGSSRSGTTSERPTLDSDDTGFEYWDSTLQKPIWWTGSAWKYSDGTSV